MRDLVVLGLATWRLTSLLVNEDGPAELFPHLRHAAGVRYDERSQRFGLNEAAKALNCVWCTSVWVGLIVSIAYSLAPLVTRLVLLPLALSAITVVVDERGINNG